MQEACTLYGCPLDGRGDRLDWPVFEALSGSDW